MGALFLQPDPKRAKKACRLKQAVAHCQRPTGARDLPPYTRRSSLPTPSSGFSPGDKEKKAAGETRCTIASMLDGSAPALRTRKALFPFAPSREPTSCA